MLRSYGVSKSSPPIKSSSLLTDIELTEAEVSPDGGGTGDKPLTSVRGWGLGERRGMETGRVKPRTVDKPHGL